MMEKDHHLLLLFLFMFDTTVVGDVWIPCVKEALQRFLSSQQHFGGCVTLTDGRRKETKKKWLGQMTRRVFYFVCWQNDPLSSFIHFEMKSKQLFAILPSTRPLAVFEFTYLYANDITYYKVRKRKSVLLLPSIFPVL